MDFSIFKQHIEEECRQGDLAYSLEPSSKFRDLENWSSMLALMLTVKITDCYGVILDEEDFKNIFTLQELFEKVKAIKSS